MKLSDLPSGSPIARRLGLVMPDHAGTHRKKPLTLQFSRAVAVGVDKTPSPCGDFELVPLIGEIS